MERRSMRGGFRITGFSLVELLIVIAIIGVLATILVPAFSTTVRAFELTRHGQQIADQLSLARQQATSKNAIVEVRFVAAGTNDWLGYQIWQISRDGQTAVPTGRLLKFPDGLMLNSSLSPLLLGSNVTIEGRTNFPGVGTADYSALRIWPGGRISPPEPRANNYLTLQSRQDSPSSPANFFTVQVDPDSGRITVFRP